MSAVGVSAAAAPPGAAGDLLTSVTSQDAEESRRLSTSDGALIEEPADDSPPYSESDSTEASKPR